MIRGIFFSIFLLQLISFNFAQEITPQELAKKFSSPARWHKLLHYKSGLFGLQSEADGKGFFFHPEGNKDPKKEFLASYQALLKEGPINDDHPICRFPARFKFFKEISPAFKKRSLKNCSAFQKFFKKINPKRVSLVFSSYFLDTPASAYGHTLLRFSKEEDNTEEFDLLDYATNYAATVTTNNSLLYAIMGISGGFKGEFSAIPYFYKVREYNDYESRDLWDYQLNLTPDQLHYMVAHIWEMKQTYFSYYYLTENCSYHMLGLIDVARPELKLTERSPYFVAPVDTIKIAVETPGLVRKITFRPSKRKIVQSKLDGLTPQEQEYFQEIYHKKNPGLIPEDFSKKAKAKIMDTAIDYLDYEYAQEMIKEAPQIMKWKRKYLIARAKLGISSPESKIPLPESERPEMGHPTRRFSLMAGETSKNGMFYNLEYRFAMHDFLDAHHGQNPLAVMEMVNVQLRYYPKMKERNERSRLELDKVSLINVTNLNPIRPYFKSTSWRFNLGLETIRDYTCHKKCLSSFFELGGGPAIKIGKHLLTYSFITTRVDVAKGIASRGYRAQLGPEALVLYRIKNGLNFLIHGNYFWNFFTKSKQKSYSYGSALRYTFIKNMAIDLNYKRLKKEGEVGLGYRLYF